MNKTLFSSTVVAAALVAAAPTFAATIMLDDFSVNQIAVSAPYAGVSDTSTIAFGAGTRTLATQNTANNGNEVAATTLEIVGGALSFSNADKATGKATLTYTNLGDIALNANPYFFFDIGVFDNIADFFVTAIDTANNVSTYEEVLNPSTNPFLYFSQFVGSADFNSLASLSFVIDTTNVPGFGGIQRVDGSLNSIQISDVPVPAAGLLLLTALGGIGAMRRRKTNQAA